MTFKVRELRSALEAKGFVLERATSHLLFRFYCCGRKTGIFTRISHGRGEELRPRLLAEIRHQLFLDTNEQLSDFVRCPLSGEAYCSHLMKKGVLVSR